MCERKRCQIGIYSWLTSNAYLIIPLNLQKKTEVIIKIISSVQRFI